MRTYPHHLTTDLPQLPVPSLQESLERYRTASAAVYGAAEEADMNQAIADFVIGPAPALQQTLEEYAESMAGSGSNWLAEQWLEKYLKVREPLLLASNATYQLDVPTASTGVERVVELLQRIGSVHILQATRDTPAEYNARGERMSMDGWAALNGGIRTPSINEDIWMRAGTGATYRTIGLLYLGRMWEVPLTGSEGKLLNTDHLRASVEFVLSQTQAAERSFAEFSALGSGVLALDAPWEGEKNRSLYNRLANMLFTLTVDPQASDDPQTLQHWAFQAGNAWVYKPISYLAALEGQLLAASVEHSVLDVGTLGAAVTRMQQVDLANLETQRDGHLNRAQELAWRKVDYDLGDYQKRANTVRVERVIVPGDKHLPYAISADARAQLVLMIAQQLTYGHIRAHNQCCDMRHYRAGRSETIRPVTIEAVNFVTSLVQDNATEAQLTAILAAHRDWILAAKSGTAFDRHMFMLQHIGEELGGANAELFTKHNKAREDFVTTVTTDGTDAIVRAVFLPSIEYGFGVHYKTVPSGTEYMVTWAERAPKGDEFIRNLEAAAKIFSDFAATLNPIIQAD